MVKIRNIVRGLILEGIEDDYKQRLIKDNPYLGMQIVNHYVNEFKKIKDNLPLDKRDITKYSWEDLEQVVDSNQSIEKIEKGIIEVDNSDVIYNQNNLKILKANTKQACIKYGTGYGFCISSRGEGNMYYDYRYGNYYDTREKSIYFVIDEDKTKDIISTNPLRFVDPTHMLVIMVIKEMDKNTDRIQLPDGSFTINPVKSMNSDTYTLFYKVTNANNDGDEIMGWNDIVELQPKLNGLQKLFQPLKPNPKEYTLHIAKKAFLDRIYEWREENEDWLGKGVAYDLELSIGDDAYIKCYTNNVETLEFNYKLLNKLKELSTNGRLQVIEFIGADYKNHLTFVTPLSLFEFDINKQYNIITRRNDKALKTWGMFIKGGLTYFKYEVLEYLYKLGLKNGFEVGYSPIIKKDVIFVEGYIKNANIFKSFRNNFGKLHESLNIKRSLITLDEDFDRYLDEINKLHREYVNDITYTLANT